VRILITGAAGFAGRHLLRELIQKRETSIWATVLEELAKPVAEEFREITWLPMDLSSEGSIRSVVEEARAEVVYHLAGQASVGESFANPVQTWEVNATGTLRLMAVLAEAKPRPRRVLLISSAEVYGSVEPAKQPIGESAPIRPLTPYGSSKAAAEIAAMQVGRSSEIEVVVARSFNHIGPGQDERFVLPNLGGQLVRMRAASEPRILQVGNLEVIRDFLDVRDVVRAYRILMDRGRTGGAYNVCSGVGRSLRGVVERLVELSGTEARLEIREERLRPADIASLIGDPGKIAGIGWSPEFSLDDTLGALLAEAETRR
jgi:GDP-4-dehydro-6-deoxy-D-mannose reductase